MEQITRNDENFPGANDHLFVLLLPKQKAQCAGNHIGDLLVVMAVSRDEIALGNGDLRNHLLFGGDYATCDRSRHLF